MKHNYYTLIAYCLFTTSLLFGQNENHKLRTAAAHFDYYPVSLMQHDGDSTTYSYDSMGRYSEERRWYWDEINDLRLASRTTDYVYTPSGKLLSLLKQSYNGATGWNSYERQTYTYDSSENLLIVLYENYDNSNGWYNDLRIKRSFDAAGNMTSSLVQNWNGTSWVLNNGLYFTYNAAGNVLTRTTDQNYRISYTYDVEENLLSEFNTHYENGLWVPSSRKTYLYSIQPDLPAIGYIDELFIGFVWKNYAKFTFTFNAAGDRTDMLSQRWNSTIADWVNSSRYHFDYDVQHNVIFQNYEEWKNEAWAKHTRYYYSFDEDFDLRNSRKEQWNNAWYAISFGRYYYQGQVSVKPLLLADFKLFPNPASTFVTLKGEDLWRTEIFDLQGHIVVSLNVAGQDEKTIQIGHLPVGKYFLRVSNELGETRTKPLVIIR